MPLRKQCRQKTVEVKAKCGSGKCTLYWCPRCLLNRYGEEVDDVRRPWSAAPLPPACLS